jgi:hypothetical protein
MARWLITKIGLTDFLYQRNGGFIAFARPDLTVAGTGSSFLVPMVDIRATRTRRRKNNAALFG